MNEYDIAVTEVLDILNYLPESMTSNIPNEFMNFLYDHKIQNYKPEFDYSLGIKNLNLRRKTKALLAMIYRNYICSEDERKLYDKKLYANEEVYQKELQEKYSADKIFENNNTQNNTDIPKDLVIISEKKWYTKIFEKIISFFKKKI